MEKEKEIIWELVALSELDKSLTWIERKSPQNAERLAELIVEQIEEMTRNPERFTLDRFKKNNRGNYRAVEVKGFRISFEIQPKRVVIKRIRSTYQTPIIYLVS